MDEFKDAKQIVLMSEADFEKSLEKALQKVIGLLKKPPEFIDEAETLQILGLRSKTSLYNLRMSGAISYSKMGKIILYRRSSLMEHIEKHELKKF